MADNYLEKRMDDYRSGRLAPGRRRSSPGGNRANPGNLCINYPDMSLLVVSGQMSELASEIVRMGIAAGIRVAVMSDNRQAASTLAQQAGARMYLSSSTVGVNTDLIRHWGGVDVILDENGVFPPSDDYRLIPLRHMDAPLAPLARLYLFMSHPDNTFFTVSE